MKDVVIELRGGVLVEVYSDNPNTRLVVIDWDNINEGKPSFVSNPAKLVSMPVDTRAQYQQALADVSDEPRIIRA